MESIDFKDELAGKLQQFEKYRQKTNRSNITYKTISKIFKFVYYPGLVVTVATFAFPFILPFTLVFIIATVALLILDWVLYNYVFKEPEVRFRAKFKEDVVRWIMQKINSTYKYEPEGKLPQENIEKASIFKSKIDLYEGEDFVHGSLNGINFQFGEATLHVDKVTFGSVAGDLAEGVLDMFFGGETTADEGQANYVKFFNGLIMQADFNKQESGTLLVIPNKVVGTGLFRKKYFEGKPRFTTGNSEFDKLFSCYTTEDLNALSVLSSEFQETIVELLQVVKARAVYLSFIKGTLTVAIDWNKDLFEADLKQGISTVKDVEFVIEQIRFFEYITTKLAVEQSIWMA